MIALFLVLRLISALLVIHYIEKMYRSESYLELQKESFYGPRRDCVGS